MAYQRSPEAFIRYLYRTLTRPSRIRKTRAGKLLNSRRLAILNDVQIDLDDLVSLYHQQDGKCAIAGVMMCHVFGKPNTISIDRIDSAKGYTLDNVHLVCQWVNLAKSKYSLEVFKRALNEFLAANRVVANRITAALERFRNVSSDSQQKDGCFRPSLRYQRRAKMSGYRGCLPRIG
jgi:hypothetical protein